MKLIRCPLNGPRPISDSSSGGEVAPMPDPDSCTDADWADYVFNRDSVPGREARVVVPHRQPATWFIAERDTATDEIAQHLRLRHELFTEQTRNDATDCRRSRASGIDRSRAARFSFEGRALPGLRRRHHRQRRWSPRASTCSAAVSNTTGRAASFDGEPRRQRLVAARRRAQRARRRRLPLREGMTCRAVNTFGGSRARPGAWIVDGLSALPAGGLLLQELSTGRGAWRLRGSGSSAA